MRLRLTLLMAGMLGAPRAIAERRLDARPARHEVQLSALAHFGVATTPFEVSSLPQAKGQAFVFHAAASYRLSNPLSLELGVPWVLGSVAQPAGAYVDAAALGNPELGASYRLTLHHDTASLLTVTTTLNVGAPLAGHAPDLMPNRVLAVASGIEGRGRPQWFTPGALPLTPSSTLLWQSPPWSLEGALQLPLLIRVSEADLPATTTRTKPLAFAAIASAEARYRFSRRLSLALTEQLGFDIVPFASHVGDISPVQDCERLSLHVHLGSQSALLVDLQTAIAGALGGTMVAGGLRAAIGL